MTNMFCTAVATVVSVVSWQGRDTAISGSCKVSVGTQVGSLGQLLNEGAVN